MTVKLKEFVGGGVERGRRGVRAGEVVTQEVLITTKTKSYSHKSKSVIHNSAGSIDCAKARRVFGEGGEEEEEVSTGPCITYTSRSVYFIIYMSKSGAVPLNVYI